MVPAFGADGIITGGAGTCTVDVLGVYDNNATANTIATWALNDYKCGAGQYLDEDTLACITCPTGSYCPGGTYTVENADEGTNACPTGYKNSDAGASSNTQCYTNCKVSDIAHATAVTGNDYYGSGADTCTATDCELGYQVESEIELVKKEPLIDIDLDLQSGDNGMASIGANGSNGDEYDSDDFTVADAGLTENNTFATAFDYGVIYGRAVCQPTVDPAYDYVKTQGGLELFETMVNAGDVDAAKAVLDNFRAGLEPLAGKAKTDYIVKQFEAIMDQNSTGSDLAEALFVNLGAAESLFWVDENTDYSADSTGKFCFCQVTDYTPNGETKSAIAGAPWMLAYKYDSQEECVSYCAHRCSLELGFPNGEDGGTSRRVMLGALTFVEDGGMCKITENNCPAGQYLAVVGDAMMCVPCKSGSYCPGGTYTIESENKGTELCPSGYPNSDAGAGADTQCYKACTLETANIAHATAVSGNDYYGTGTDTCSATECVKGYHTDGRIQFVEKTPVVNVDPSSINGIALIDGTGWAYNENLPNSGLTENNTIAVSFTNGILYGRASCQPSMDTGMEYMMNNMDAVMDGSMSVEDFRAGLEPLMGVTKTDFAIDLLNRVQSGDMSMDEAELKFMAVFLSDKNANYTTSSAGKYCYFQVNGFAPSGGTKSDIVGLPWILLPEPFESADECASNCIMSGAEFAANIAAPVTLGALDYVETSICAANTINIDWNPDNGGDHTQNMCLYDGAITLPTPDPVKPGYVFSGWKLVE